MTLSRKKVTPAQRAQSTDLPPPSTPGVGTALPLADAGKRDPRPAFIELPTYRTYYELRPKIPHPNRPKPAVKVYAGLSPSSVSG